MFTIAVIGQKGGTGKTTTSTGLAVAMARAKKAVAIIDVDPQANAASWKDRRADENPAVVAVPVARIKATLQAAEENGADYVIIDTPGKSDSAAIEAARVADLVLIPVRSQIFDLETLPGVRDLLRVAGDPPAFVIVNGIHPQATKGAEEAKVMIEQTFGFNCAPVHLCHRGVYAEAPTTGQAPQELEPKGKASEELNKLYMFVSKQLNMLTGKHEQESKQTAKRA